MDFKLFTDLYNTLKSVFADIKSLADIPVEERKKYRDVLGETYSMLDVSLNMVISRLADTLREPNDDFKLQAVQNLEYMNDWLEAERRFRLCSNLRATLSETRHIRDKLVGKHSVNNWDKLIALMESIMATEGELADYISKEFSEISYKARQISVGSSEYKKQLKALEDFRKKLINERRELIKEETKLYDEII